MDKFEIIASQTPGIINFSNYDQVKTAVNEYVSSFSEVDYSAEGIDAAERDSKEIKSYKDAISKVKKELCMAYSAPYVEVEKKLDELLAILDVPFKKAKNFVDESARSSKERDIVEYAYKVASVLGDKAGKIVESKSFFNPKWLNKTTSMKVIQDEINSIVKKAVNDISIIQSTGGEQTNVLLARYYETLSIEGMDSFIENVRLDDSHDAPNEDIATHKNVLGYRI